MLSFIPGNQLPHIQWDLISVDTLVHFGLYLTLAFAMVLGRSPKKMNLSPARWYLMVLLAGVVYGTTIELIQGFCIYQRYFDLKDVLANTIGTIFGVFIGRLICIKLV